MSTATDEEILDFTRGFHAEKGAHKPGLCAWTSWPVRRGSPDDEDRDRSDRERLVNSWWTIETGSPDRTGNAPRSRE